MISPEKLQGIIDKFESIERQLGDPEVIRDMKRLQPLSREHARLREVVLAARLYQKVHADLEEARDLARSSDDAEMRQMARQEQETLKVREEELAARLQVLLLPPDPLSEKNTIVEIRAGTGGDEAALFAGDPLTGALLLASVLVAIGIGLASRGS
jgi:peptide chain release factor 1